MLHSVHQSGAPDRRNRCQRTARKVLSPRLPQLPTFCGECEIRILEQLLGIGQIHTVDIHKCIVYKVSLENTTLQAAYWHTLGAPSIGSSTFEIFFGSDCSTVSKQDSRY